MMTMGSGMSSHEYRGPHTVHDRAEKAERHLDEIEAFIRNRRDYWQRAEFGEIATELQLALVKLHDIRQN